VSPGLAISGDAPSAAVTILADLAKSDSSRFPRSMLPARDKLVGAARPNSVRQILTYLKLASPNRTSPGKGQRERAGEGESLWRNFLPPSLSLFL
jgi:hypothetical protein